MRLFSTILLVLQLTAYRFLSALMAVSAKKELIDRLCVARDEMVGVYGFVFYRDGEWVPIVIDDKLYLRVRITVYSVLGHVADSC